MARSQFQSDFVVHRDEPPAELPVATLQSNEASTRATRAVYWAMFIVLGLLAVMTIVGPHIPAGE